MTNLVPHIFEEKFVRTFIRADGEPCFIAKDVCACLEIKKTDSALRNLDEDEKGTRLMSTLGGDQQMSYVTESGLYTLILRSRKAVTPGTVQHRFRRWITFEVLPTLRTTGHYEMPGQENEGPAFGPLPEVANKARLVELALKLKGRKAACDLWDELGLPHLAAGEGPSVSPMGAVDQLLPQLRLFIAERLELAENVVTPARALFETYCAWASETEKSVASEAGFGRAMAFLAAEVGFQKVKRRTIWYRGLRIKGGDDA